MHIQKDLIDASDPEEEARSEESTDDEMAATPPPLLVEVERVWSRRTSLRYQQLTVEKLKRDLVEKERAATDESSRVSICLFPDVFEASAPCIVWRKEDTECVLALARCGNTLCLSHLLDSSFEPSSASVGGVTIAMAAAREGQLEVLDLLMRRGLDLKMRDDSDRSVLHYAATCAGGNVISYLLTHPNAKQCKNIRHQIPLDISRAFMLYWHIILLLMYNISSMNLEAN